MGSRSLLFVLAFFIPLIAHSQTPQELFHQAQREIQKGDREEARESLERALSADPDFVDAKIQLGFLELWEGNLLRAYQLFVSSLELDPCNGDALDGLRELGSRWSQIESRQSEIANIYGMLNHCEPNNPDTLFYQGRALVRSGQWEEAEKVLKECLAIDPQYVDAEIQLAYLYLWQKRWSEAKKILSRYPCKLGAKLGLARAARYQGNYAEAKRHLQEILSKKPSNREARKEYAQTLYANRDYSEAEEAFSWLIDDDPSEGDYWPALFDMKSHTHCALKLETLYTYAKENDPSVRAPVVKDYYFYNAVHLFVPMTDHWRVDWKELYYHQRENDIFPPLGVNYSVYLSGGQVTSRYFFAENWRWDLSARAFHAWGKQNATYPFQKTTRFEAGTKLLYNSERQLFSFDAHRESFIIKDFSKDISNLLRTDYLVGGYAYRFPWKLRHEVEAWITHVFIHDRLNNWENTEKATVRCNLFSKYVTAIYRFEHGHFDRLSQNYYSFNQQLRNVLGARIEVPLVGSSSWKTIYYHRWQSTYNLFQPIGNTVYVAAKQYLVANWVTSSLNIRYRDKIRVELEGHYFHDTLPYRDWGVKGSFLWQF